MAVDKSSPLLIAGAWLIVVVPAGWGLSYTLRNAAKLFADAPAAASAAPSSAAPASSAVDGGAPR